MMLDEAALIIKEQIERKESGEKPIQPGDVVKRLIKATSAPKSTPEVHRAVPIATASGKNMIEFTAGNARTAATIKLLPASDATRDEMKRAVTDLVDQRSEEHTSELQSLMRISYAVFCLKKKRKHHITLHVNKLL